MDLREIQVASSKWRDRNFPEDTIETQFIGMCEELGEIAHAVLKRKQNIRALDAVAHSAAIRDGCADLLIFMCGFADHEGFDLLDALNETWAEVGARDWIKFPKNGVSE